MTKIGFHIACLFCLLLGLGSPQAARAESQDTDYKGITDPFGDPQNQEFSEDEKADKEWFHLGRFLMLGIDGGGAVFTGGLGETVNPGPYFGVRLVYFFDRLLAMEAATHYSNHLDQVISQQDPTSQVSIDTNMVPITLGFRYYFDVRSAPKALAVANPYIVAGPGLYLRTQTVIARQGTAFTNLTADGNTSNFGFFGGGGVEFLIYQRHVYLGIDLRYHIIFFVDADSTFNENLAPGSRSGDYFTPAITLTYNF